jgi:Zn-dependent metalloprotease
MLTRTLLRFYCQLGLYLVWSSSLLFAQQPSSSLAKKGIRLSTPVNTTMLNPVTIKGQHVQKESSTGRQQSSLIPSYLQGKQLRIAPSTTPAATNLPQLEVKRSVQTGLPIFIRETKGGFSLGATNGRVDLNRAAPAYLERVKDLLQIQQPSTEFQVADIQTDALRQSHIRLKQHYQGIEVYGSELILHLQNNTVQSLNGRHFPTPGIADLTARISTEGAIQTAIADVQQRTSYHILSKGQQEILTYDKPTAKLIIYHPNNDLASEYLTWHINIRPNFMEVWDYFVDAQTGKILSYHNHTCSADGGRTASAKDLSGTIRQLQTYQVGSNYYLIDGSRSMFKASSSKLPNDPVGALWTVDARRTYGKNFAAYQISSNNNAWNDPVSVSAHYNGSKAFEYFKNVHNRNSLDGKGGTIISLINVMDDDGKELDNAFWNGKVMAYGNGNLYFKAFAGGLDVAGHEMSHGVIQNSANLEYQGQSGAINESFADIFGAMIDSEDWKIGEDIVKTSAYPSGALRDLADPHNGGSSISDVNRGYQPRIMSELYTGTQDNGGVHVNSGIPNWAFYKFATEISKAKAEKVYYRALTTYLTSRSQFVDLRLAVIQAATDLYGATSTEVGAARRAFDAVGILETGGTDDTDTTTDLPTNPGQDYILSHDASYNDSDPNTWYVTTADGSSLVARSKTASRSKASVTDRGDLAYFVGADKRIHAVTLSGSAQESLIQGQPIWSNVAISKDGKRLAAVSAAADTSVYVYDFDQKKWAKFVLYNPTYSQNVKTGDVRFADALEWDYTGEYLLYDAFNVINTTSGEAIEYWDVGLIKVWDKQLNSFGKGTIEKIFTSLPAGVSIGNPSFSKNSPSIVAFDYANSEEDSYAILAANLKKGQVGAIAENTMFGYPTFSKNDDKLAYTSYSEEGDTVINIISLQADKISAVGSPATLLKEAKWAVWYVQGERKVLSSIKEITAFQFGGLTAPAVGTINATTIQVVVPPSADLGNLIAYFAHSPQSKVTIGNTEQISGVTKNDFSKPVTYTVKAQDGTTKNYTVTVTKGVSTGTEDLQDISHEVSVYPNPTQGLVQIRWDASTSQSIHLELFNTAGTRVAEKQLSLYTNEGIITWQLPPVSAGLYYIRLTTDKKSARKRLLVR